MKDAPEADQRQGRERGTRCLPVRERSALANRAGFWFRRACHLIAAMMFVALGLAGAVLPGLPATPFFLLASYFLARSSPRLNERLHRCWFIGQILNDWQQQRGVRRRVKVQAVGTVLLCVGATVLFSSLAAMTLVLIVMAAASGILIVCLLPSAKAPSDAFAPPRQEFAGRLRKESAHAGVPHAASSSPHVRHEQVAEL